MIYRIYVGGRLFEFTSVLDMMIELMQMFRKIKNPLDITIEVRND